MAWFKVDDQLHDHRKARAAGKSAMGVWVLAGSWCSERENDGFVPSSVLSRWGTKADARRLVTAGLWVEGVLDGEPGWWFHDWTIFQPDAATLRAQRVKESVSGQLGNHKRWHLARGVTVPDCEFCYRVPDQEPDGEPDRVSVGVGIGSASPVPVPEPDREVPNGTSRVGSAIEPTRDDVERLCNHLAKRIEGNGAKRPTITAKWRTAARLMIDADGRPEDEIHRAIDWCQSDEFWRGNVLSMPKLREKYDQLKLQAARRPSGATSRTEEWRAMQERQMARAIEREREMGLRS
jgi:hypothetical protein